MKKHNLFVFAAVLTLLVFSLACCGEKKEEKQSSVTSSPLPDEKLVNTVSDGTWMYSVYSSFVEISAYYGGGVMAVVPDSYGGLPVSSIGDSAFTGNTTLVNVILPDSVVNIANKAFSGCTSLKEIRMNGVRAFGMHCFENTAITDIVFPARLANLGKYAFYSGALRSVTINSGIEGTEAYVFAECASLEEVIFPSDFRVVSDRMFSGCASLKEVEIPDTVKELGDYAFAGCSSLEKLVIPASVDKIGVGLTDGSPSAVLYVKKGSAAEKYALENGAVYQNY